MRFLYLLIFFIPLSPTQALEIYDFKSGLMCGTNKNDIGRVCFEGKRILITGQSTCDSGGVTYKCTWYGYSYNYRNAEIGQNVECVYTYSTPVRGMNWAKGPSEESRITTFSYIFDKENGYYVNPQYSVLPPKDAKVVDQTQSVICKSRGETLYEYEFTSVFPTDDIGANENLSNEGVRENSYTENPYVDVEELRVVINSGDIDRIVVVLNAIKAMRHKDDQLNLILEMWERKTGNGISNIGVLNQEIVRAEFADILIQSVRNGHIEVDEDILHSQVISHVSSRDPQVRRAAVLTLANFDRCTDVPLLKQTALKDPRTLRASLLTLVRLCCDDAVGALEEIVEAVDHPRDKYIVRRLTSSNSLKKMRLTRCAK